MCSHKYPLKYACALPSQLLDTSSSDDHSSFQTGPHFRPFLNTEYPKAGTSFCPLRGLSSLCSTTFIDLHFHHLTCKLGIQGLYSPTFKALQRPQLSTSFMVSLLTRCDPDCSGNSHLGPCPGPNYKPSVFYYLFSFFKTHINSCLLHETSSVNLCPQ